MKIKCALFEDGMVDGKGSYLLRNEDVKGWSIYEAHSQLLRMQSMF